MSSFENESPIRVLVVGCGNMGASHAFAYQLLDGFEICGIVSTGKSKEVLNEKLGGGYITVMIKGDVAAVKAAIEAGKEKVGTLGKLIAAHVIPRPSTAVLTLLPKSS